MTAVSKDPDFDLDALLGPAPAVDASTLSRGVSTSAAEPVPSMAPNGTRPSARPAHALRRDKIGAGFTALRRHRRPALAAFFFAIAVSAIVTVTATPIYEARARVQFEPQARRVLPFRAVADDGRAMTRELRRNPDTAFTIRQLVRPRDLARRTLEDLDLWDVMASQVPARVVEADLAPAMQGPRGRAVRGMMRGMRMSAVPRSRLIDFRFRAADPALAERVANGLAAGFIALSVEAQAGKAREATAWLDEQVETLRRQVASAEQALQQYREQHGAVAMRASSTAVRRLIDLSSAATDARTTRIEKEVVHRQLAAGLDPGADEAQILVLDGALRRQRDELDALDRQEAELAAKLGDRHPDLQAVRRAIESAETNLAAGMARVVERAQAEYDVALAQEREILSALERQKGEALASDRVGIELRLLEADVQSARRIYTNVSRRRDQLRLSEALSIAGMRVVDPAERPSRPVYPKPWLSLLIGTGVGLILARSVAGGLDYWRRMSCTPEEVRQHLGAAVLGELPLQASHMFGEALNALRTNVRFAVPEGSHVIVVTSAEPGEGKSTVTAQLGAALARDGQRVLIVDADMRRPVLHTVFGTKAEPGLSNVLVGAATDAECVLESSEPGLFLLPAGRIPPNPSELLLSSRYRELAETFEARFDWVLIDAPPVLAVTDPVVLAQSASGFVFIVDGRSRNMRRLAFALEQMQRAQPSLLGVVINRAVEDVPA